jgi:hypothetical protein
MNDRAHSQGRLHGRHHDGGGAKMTSPHGRHLGWWSQRSNQFIVDGMDTTNREDRCDGQAVVTDFVEVQVKTSGYNAEFGATGDVVSAS